MRFLFFSRNPGWPHLQIRPARTIWRPQYTVSAPVFSRITRSGTRLMLCALVRQRGAGAGDVARPCRHMLVEAKGFSSRWRNFKKQASGSVPTANGGGERMVLYEMFIACGIAVLLGGAAGAT